MPSQICVVFDIGKTNKKIIAFDRAWQVVFESQTSFAEVSDEDGFHGDNLMAITQWMLESFEELQKNANFEIKAVNFSGYGASLVHFNAQNEVCTQFFNYLKAFPRDLKVDFIAKYGEGFFTQTASPDLGFLNSGLQLYWLKYAKPQLYAQIEATVHFPQYLSWVFTGQKKAEYTSIGCHTALWDFKNNDYHTWLAKENIKSHLAPIVSAQEVSIQNIHNQNIAIGTGIHDSSAALVPYLETFAEPFVLISTGTWCISINPFNQQPLNGEELAKDALNFISYQGQPIKASRLFAGNEHQRQVKHLAEHFKVDQDFFKAIAYSPELIKELRGTHKQAMPHTSDLGLLRECPFVERNLNLFKNPTEAYHQFMLDLVAQQIASIQLVMSKEIKIMFVDGGFTKNELYMKLLAEAFFQVQVYASKLGQGSSVGAALAIDHAWQPEPFGQDLFELDRY
jgi:L-fuculokinase